MKAYKIGRVVKVSGINTVKVEVKWWKLVPKYQKKISRVTNYLCHTTTPLEIMGYVKIKQVRPFSKMKHHEVVEVLNK